MTPRPNGTPTMTEAQVDALRATVPDNPVRLPEGWLACEGCGVAVPHAETTSTATPWPATENSRVMPAPVPFGRCPACQSLHDAADAYVEAHPLLARRVGPQLAREHIERALFALAILRQPTPEDIGFLLPRMLAAGSCVRFANPLTLTRGLCSPRPWAHVTVGQRAALRRAYAEVLRDRLALNEPPVALPCPTRGCLLCGVVAVSRSAIEVARRGGREASVAAVWRPMTVPPVALGGQGPQPVRGHVCPACDDAIQTVGAIGLSARGRALVAHIRPTLGDSKADRLRSMLADEFPPTLPGWGALRLPPNRQPWSHLNRVVDRL